MKAIFRIAFYYLVLNLLSCSEQSSQADASTTKIEPIAAAEKLTAGFLIVEGVYNSELMAPYDIFQHTIFHTDKTSRAHSLPMQWQDEMWCHYDLHHVIVSM